MRNSLVSSAIIQLPASEASPSVLPVPHPFNTRILFGIVGVFVAAMMSGLNSRISGLSLVDIGTVFGFGSDKTSWIGSLYSSFELAAMPFATWFAVTFSFRRFHIGVVVIFTLLALCTPFVPNFAALLVMRCLQGFFGGLLIPVLMAAALRFFPPPLRLYGLAMYAMTATFAPNVATWLSAIYTDTLENWHLVFWQIIPLALFSAWAVAWGVPQDPVRLDRLKDINLLGLLTGVCGLVFVGLGLSQGERYDWFHDPVIVWLFFAGGLLTAVFLFTEWYHSLPFIKLQLLRRRNLGLGFTVFFLLLVVLLSGSVLPAEYLSETRGFRTPYIVSIGLIVGSPQLILGPIVSFLLYKKWMDARYMFIGGLGLLAASCAMDSQITTDWIADNFLIGQLMHAFGQPMAVISMLFLATSVVHPTEGPVVSGIVNLLRALGTLSGDAILGRLIAVREKVHSNIILDTGINAGAISPAHSGNTIEGIGNLAERVSHQAFVLSISDAYLFLGALAIILIPMVLNLQYISPPVIQTNSK